MSLSFGEVKWYVNQIVCRVHCWMIGRGGGAGVKVQR